MEGEPLKVYIMIQDMHMGGFYSRESIGRSIPHFDLDFRSAVVFEHEEVAQQIVRDLMMTHGTSSQVVYVTIKISNVRS